MTLALSVNTWSGGLFSEIQTHQRRPFNGTNWAVNYNARRRTCNRRSFEVKASCIFNPTDEPIIKEALKEPVAFMGGLFAGLLRLDLNEEPLKEWLTRTVESSGVSQETYADGSKPEGGGEEEEAPQQIEIE
ncbi:hypothetical protein K2173_021129 [Erythroxylum novogranatense]|uniref:Uncharacterized protein n=1 Tax=Erythroxylum novogranatense TaxID=1862640 RepID=A0AAV8TPW8_9ROSI|nr:hypothetical protein K2173_021129 [Erythroxylum novogranatense]